MPDALGPMERMLLQIMFGQWRRYIKEDRIDLLEKELAQAVAALEEDKK